MNPANTCLCSIESTRDLGWRGGSSWLLLMLLMLLFLPLPAAGRGKRAGGFPPSLHPDLEMTHLILTHIPQRKFSHGHTWAWETQGNMVQFSSHVFSYYSTVEKEGKERWHCYLIYGYSHFFEILTKLINPSNLWATCSLCQLSPVFYYWGKFDLASLNNLPKYYTLFKQRQWDPDQAIWG